MFILVAVCCCQRLLKRPLPLSPGLWWFCPRWTKMLEIWNISLVFKFSYFVVDEWSESVWSQSRVFLFSVVPLWIEQSSPINRKITVRHPNHASRGRRARASLPTPLETPTSSGSRGPSLWPRNKIVPHAPNFSLSRESFSAPPNQILDPILCSCSLGTTGHLDSLFLEQHFTKFHEVGSLLCRVRDSQTTVPWSCRDRRSLTQGTTWNELWVKSNSSCRVSGFACALFHTAFAGQGLGSVKQCWLHNKQPPSVKCGLKHMFCIQFGHVCTCAVAIKTICIQDISFCAQFRRRLRSSRWSSQGSGRRGDEGCAIFKLHLAVQNTPSLYWLHDAWWKELLIVLESEMFSIKSHFSSKTCSRSILLSNGVIYMPAWPVSVKMPEDTSFGLYWKILSRENSVWHYETMKLVG